MTSFIPSSSNPSGDKDPSQLPPGRHTFQTIFVSVCILINLCLYIPVLLEEAFSSLVVVPLASQIHEAPGVSFVSGNHSPSWGWTVASCATMMLSRNYDKEEQDTECRTIPIPMFQKNSQRDKNNSESK